MWGTKIICISTIRQKEKNHGKHDLVHGFSTIQLKNIYTEWNKVFVSPEEMIMNGTKVVFAEQINYSLQSEKVPVIRTK
jgi:hypothetical protein